MGWLARRRLRRHKERLYSQSRFLGPRQRSRAASYLASDPSTEAAQALVDALIRSRDPRVVAIVEAAFADPTKAQLAALFSGWMSTRASNLEKVISSNHLEAPWPYRAFAALKFGPLQAILERPQDSVTDVLRGVGDLDPQIRDQAASAISLLCGHDESFRVLLGLVATGGLSAGAKAQVLTVFTRISETHQVDAICEKWAETRSDDLTELLKSKAWSASAPPSLRVLTALKFAEGRGIDEREDLDEIMALLETGDSQLVEQALLKLRSIHDRQLQDDVCQRYLKGGDERAKSVAVAAGWRPFSEDDYVLFLLLTDQWDSYQGVDFDGSIIRALFDAGDVVSRNRIVSALARAGRPEVAAVLAGGEIRARIASASSDEINSLVATLVRHEDWPRLWQLASELSVMDSARALLELLTAKWQPHNQDDLDVFRELQSIAQRAYEEAPEVTAKTPAIYRQTIRVASRINDVAFSPLQPEIAIAMSSRQVVVWDMQRSYVARRYGPFDHSISRVAFGQHGDLFCGERTNSPDASCSVYHLPGTEARSMRERVIASHQGTVTGLAPLGENAVLTSGRDGYVKVTSYQGSASGGNQQWRPLRGTWPRSVAISQDSGQAALLHRGVAILDLKSGRVISSHADSGQSVINAAAFAPTGGSVIGGCHSGALVVLERRGDGIRFAELPHRHSEVVQGVLADARRGLVVTAGAEGVVRFLGWPSRKREVGYVRVNCSRLTSLHIAVGGEAMATGTSEATMQLWDLRALDVPSLLEKPMARATPLDLEVLESVADTRSARVEFARKLLRHRFRFDIGIDTTPRIRYGEFDIEVA